MEPIDAAWIAGYIDGDGTISMLAHGKRKYRYPEICIGSCDKELLDRVKYLIGGSITKKKVKPNQRPAWWWRLAGSTQVIKALSEIAPHLRGECKKQRANLILSKYTLLTASNGYYRDEQASAKIAFEDEFFSIGSDRDIRRRLSWNINSRQMEKIEKG